MVLPASATMVGAAMHRGRRRRQRRGRSGRRQQGENVLTREIQSASLVEFSAPSHRQRQNGEPGDSGKQLIMGKG